MINEFEFDPAKSAANRLKHGIDFEEAQELWEDERRLEIPVRVQDGEERWALIAMFWAKVWTAIFTWRGRNVRIISVRRARQEEEALYGQENLGN